MARVRLGPLAGAASVPGLLDEKGALWGSVAEVVTHASPDEVEREIRAQLDRTVRMGFHPTHLDSHMSTLFATPAFLEGSVQLGIEKQIPVMMPAGHATDIQADRRNAFIAQLAPNKPNNGIAISSARTQMGSALF